MNDDARDSLGDFQSSIFDASDGHQLVDFIRKKKGLRTQPLKIFDDVRTDRQSLQIEIQMLDDEEPSNTNDNTLQPEPEAQKDPSPVKLVNNNDQSTSARNNSFNQTRRTVNKSPAYGDTKLKLKRLSHSIGRRTLLKEFEKTLQDSRFLPTTCSTPFNQDSPNVPVHPPFGEKSPNQPKTNVRKSVNQELVCSPITITDTDSPMGTTTPPPPPKDQSKQNKTTTSNENTEDVMRDLQEQNDMLLALEDSFNEADNTVNENENPSSSLNRDLRIPSPHRTYTTNNTQQRRTYTVQRDSTSGKLILSPYKSSQANAREPLSPKTPIKNVRINTTKLVVTPEQKRLLLSRFGRNSAVASSPQQQAAASVQKASRIPIVSRGGNAGPPPPPPSDKPSTSTCQVVHHQDTAQIIEQLQKGNPTNTPVIVIPVNQTFNQAPVAEKAPAKVVEKPPLAFSSPNSNEISSTTTSTIPQPDPIETHTSNDERIPVNSLRIEDIITEDEDSSSAEDPPKTRSRLQQRQRQSKSTSDKLKKLSLTRRAPQPKTSSRNVRQIISSQELGQLSMHQILDLRKRNSRGELQKNFQLSARDINMLDKQVELELLRRSIHENNCEDEILQMEVVPAPPEEFSDNRKSSKMEPPLAPDNLVIEDDLIGERSSDRISLSQGKHQHVSNKSGVVRRAGRRKRELPEQVEKYLEASVIVSKSKSKYLNYSKRKLYSKGNSDETSDESSPRKSYLRIIQSANASKLSRSSRKQSHGIPDKSRQTVTSSHYVSPPQLQPSPPSQPSPPLHLSPPAEFATRSHRSPHHRRSSPQQSNSPRQRPSQRSSHQHTSPPRHSVPRRSTPRHTSPRHSAPRQPPSSPPRPSGTPSSPLPSPPAGFTNESDIRIQFLPNDNDLFKKPVGIPPKKKVTKKKPKPPAAAPHPVDPDVVSLSSNDETPSVRRSSRQKKPLTAYWSCSQKEFTPLFDFRILYQKKNSSMLAKANAKNKAQNLPRSDNNLVANTKTVRSNSVEKTQKTKKLTKKQQKEQESLQAKEAQQNVSVSNSLSSHCPSFHSSASATESHLPRIQVKRFATMTEDPKAPIPLGDAEESASERAIVTEVLELNENHTSSAVKSKRGSKPKKTKKSKAEQAKLSTDDSQGTSSDCPPKSVSGQQLLTITEDSESDTHHPGSTQAELKKSSKSKLKGPKSKMHIPTEALLRKNAEKSKSKGARSKKQQSSSDSNTTSSDSPSEDYSSSIQQVRLATIAEDSIPEPVCEVTVTASEKAISTRRLRAQPRSRSNKSKQTAKDAFRTEHDESIADVSSVHVNKLFDQLKSSSMCAATDVVTTAQQMSCSGQVSHNSRAKDHHTEAASKCKNLTVRLLRMKSKQKSPQGDEKVCDSGFSSEDMSSARKQKDSCSGDLLLNWLKDILSKSPRSSEKGVARFLQADGFHAASVDDLIFQELDGVDYAFYNTKERFSFGYMRFNPRTQKKKCIAKKYELNLFVLCGTLKITVNRNTFDCKSGDLITVFIGTAYGINNISNDPALVMVIKK